MDTDAIHIRKDLTSNWTSNEEIDLILQRWWWVYTPIDILLDYKIRIN